MRELGRAPDPCPVQCSEGILEITQSTASTFEKCPPLLEREAFQHDFVSVMRCQVKGSARFQGYLWIVEHHQQPTEIPSITPTPYQFLKFRVARSEDLLNAFLRTARHRSLCDSLLLEQAAPGQGPQPSVRFMRPGLARLSQLMGSAAS